MKIALFGGVFSPPHIGHVLIAQQVLDFTDHDEVWYLPNFDQSPPKRGVAAVEHRLAMLAMITRENTRISTLEIDHKLNGETITLLPHLPSEHGYTFLMGSDQLAGFEQWRDWQKLLSSMPFLIFPRYGYPVEHVKQNMSVLDHELLVTSNISSTLVRRRVGEGLSVGAFVPHGVGEYIGAHKLYEEAT